MSANPTPTVVRAPAPARTPSKAQAEQAGHIFRYLLVKAHTGMPSTYTEVAQIAGTHHRQVGALLNIVAGFCSDAGIPHLTAFVVRQDTGEVGDGWHRYISPDDPEQVRYDAQVWATWLRLGARYNLIASWAAWQPRYFAPW